jgi:2-methylcitrate dehydratase PrpD
MDLCNQQNITRGLQGKFSVYHGAAIGLVLGKAGLREYSDETVNDPQVRRVRERTTAVGDSSITEDQARIDVELADGRTLEIFIEQSLGNLNRPMTDRQLDAKFRDQAVLALPASQVDSLLDLCWRIDEVDDVNEVVGAAVPLAEAARL